MLDWLAIQGPLEWLVSLLAIVYVLLAAQNKPLAWVFGGLACAGWAYIDIAKYSLYSDALLQVFYVFMSILGLYQWRKGKEGQLLPITKMSRQAHFYVIGAGLLSGLLLGYFVGEHFPAAATYWDAITTTFSVGATFLLLRRKLENWLYWIVIDLNYIGIYASREAWFFAGLMGLYTLIALWGYQQWRDLRKQELNVV